MHMVVVKHCCPCCGYEGLEVPAYRHLGPPPWFHIGPPPYERWYGDPSYEVCACCGFEFGNDDNPGTSAPVTFEEHWQDWAASGWQWFDPAKRPADWDRVQQLRRIGVTP
jgi:hypothetical protein